MNGTESEKCRGRKNKTNNRERGETVVEGREEKYKRREKVKGKEDEKE